MHDVIQSCMACVRNELKGPCIIRVVFGSHSDPLNIPVAGFLRARVGRPQTSSSPPVIFIAVRPKAALLFWFFGGFRCGALLFMVIHVIYKYENR